MVQINKLRETFLWRRHNLPRMNKKHDQHKYEYTARPLTWLMLAGMICMLTACQGVFSHRNDAPTLAELADDSVTDSETSQNARQVQSLRAIDGEVVLDATDDDSKLLDSETKRIDGTGEQRETKSSGDIQNELRKDDEIQIRSQSPSQNLYTTEYGDDGTVQTAEYRQPPNPATRGGQIRYAAAQLGLDGPTDNSVDTPNPLLDPDNPLNRVPFDVYVEEARTGSFHIGAGVNSDAGFTGQLMYDERNFDYRAVPSGWQDFRDGKAFRGGGQGFRIEAMPGEWYERYMLQYSDPYWRNTNISMSFSGYYYDRIYRDWDENRTGGRISFGYRLTPDLSVNGSLKLESVEISDPRVSGVPDLENVLGENDNYSFRMSLSHDTRDAPFLATEGHFFEMSFEQTFGSFTYPTGEVEYSKHFLVRERADGTGRHTFSYNLGYAVTGDDTPLFERLYAGGYATIRGFRFRGASPVDNGVQVGGNMRFLGTLQYMFPVTGDDMLRGVVFTDFGTVEEATRVDWEDFRVVVGFGLRISIPMMGPAPFAFDFAIPLNREETDQIRNFSFFFGISKT